VRPRGFPTVSTTSHETTRGAAVTAQRTDAGPYRADLDGLRAVAILSVLAFHAFPHAVPGGFTGVDVFFVISGFLISRIVFAALERGTFTFAGFYARRVRRIFPSLVVVLIAALALGWMIQPQSEYAQLGKHAAAGAGFLSNFASWTDAGYFDTSANAKPLLHLWSLGIEEQFYIVFPPLIVLAWRMRIPRMPLLLAIAAVSFAASLYLMANDPSAAFYMPHARSWELAAGCLLAQAGVTDPALGGRTGVATACGQRVRNLVSFAAALLVAAGLILIDETRDFPGAWALLPTAGAALLIWSGPDATVNRRILAHPWLIGIGLISYQLYLWHWPLLSFLHLTRPEDSGLASRALALAASFPLAWATYAWIDKPIRTGPRSRAVVTLACAALVVAGVTGWAVYANRGVPGRLPDSLSGIAGFTYEYEPAFREGTCFLKREQRFEQFGDCTRTVEGSDSVVLWGDSHAAHLYAGLQQAADGRFTLTQLTASWCAPILKMEDVHARPHCKSINEGVFARIARERPQEVILAAYWPAYRWTNLPATIDALLTAGVARVVVVGAGPHFADGVARLLYVHAREDVLSHRIPLRLANGAAAEDVRFDAQFAKAIARTGARYVSVLSIVCDDSGCLTRTREDDVSSLMFWDSFHLTSEGSRYVVSHFPEGSLPGAK